MIHARLRLWEYSGEYERKIKVKMRNVYCAFLLYFHLQYNWLTPNLWFGVSQLIKRKIKWNLAYRYHLNFMYYIIVPALSNRNYRLFFCKQHLLLLNHRLRIQRNYALKDPFVILLPQYPLVLPQTF